MSKNIEWTKALIRKTSSGKKMLNKHQKLLVFCLVVSLVCESDRFSIRFLLPLISSHSLWLFRKKRKDRLKMKKSNKNQERINLSTSNDRWHVLMEKSNEQERLWHLQNSIYLIIFKRHRQKQESLIVYSYKKKATSNCEI
jgi:hypothetical protein